MTNSLPPCGPNDYNCWLTYCNSTALGYSNECMEYFLSLPPGGSGTLMNRSNFAVGRCETLQDMTRPECRVLCRDSPATCRQQRKNLCRDFTLNDLIQGSEIAKLCSCYLNQDQYRIALDKIIKNIKDNGGDSNAANALMSQIQFPICYFGDCASSGYGNDTESILCPDVKVCLQSIVPPEGSGSATLVNNCVLGDGVPLNNPVDVQIRLPFIIYPLIIFVIILVIIFLWVLFKPIKKPEKTYVPLRLG